MNDLDRARSLLSGLAGQHEVLGKLASGTLSAADLPALQRAAAELGLDAVATALGQLAAGKSPTSILAFLVASGDVPDLMPRLVELQSTADDIAAVLRLAGRGRIG